MKNECSHNPLAVTGEDVVHTGQIRGVWKGNENNLFFLKYIYFLCKRSWWVFFLLALTLDTTDDGYIWFVYTTCILFYFFPSMPQAPVWHWSVILIWWYFHASVWSVYGFWLSEEKIAISAGICISLAPLMVIWWYYWSQAILLQLPFFNLI